jgi:hypothetical protein
MLIFQNKNKNLVIYHRDKHTIVHAFTTKQMVRPPSRDMRDTASAHTRTHAHGAHTRPLQARCGVCVCARAGGHERAHRAHGDDVGVVVLCPLDLRSYYPVSVHCCREPAAAQSMILSIEMLVLD